MVLRAESDTYHSLDGANFLHTEAHQFGQVDGMFDAGDDALKAQTLQAQPQRQTVQFGAQVEGGQACSMSQGWVCRLIQGLYS